MKTFIIPYSKITQNAASYKQVEKITSETVRENGVIHSTTQLLKRLDSTLANEILYELEIGNEVELDY